jgi:MFS family permease
MEVVMNQRRRDLILAVLALAGAVFAVLQAVVVPALPEIDRALHAAPSSGTWILTVNLLATAVLTPVLGRMGDIHGKDRMLGVVVTALGLGTLACALAPSLPVMLAGRVAQGAGGAVFPLAFGVLRDELPRDRVAGAIGLVSSLLGVGAGLGLVIAGPIIAALSWRWLFWLPLAVLVPVAGAVVRWVPASPVRAPAPVNLASAALRSPVCRRCSSPSVMPVSGGWGQAAPSGCWAWARCSSRRGCATSWPAATPSSTCG